MKALRTPTPIRLAAESRMKGCMKARILPLLQPVIVAALPLMAAGCVSAPHHRAAVRDESASRLTVGTVQKNIRTGMSSAEVVAVLGNPNIVTTDAERREVWTYDKVSTETVSSGASIGIVPMLFGLNAPWAGGASGHASQAASATATSQRTLTVVIRFDAQQRVRDFAYHASSF